MNFSAEWRFLWSTSYTSRAPQLIKPAGASSTLGPLLFHPVPATLTPLISSQNLSPPSIPPCPSLSIPRFLQTTSSVLPTTSATISSAFLSTDSLPSPAPSFANNHLEPLPCPDGCSTIAFFPTGDNLDRIGFVLLSVEDSQICVKGDVFLSSTSFGHRILQLAACAAGSDVDGDDCAGYLMASTLYSVHWFRVTLIVCRLNFKKPVLVDIGSRLFNSAVVHVCWNPHFPEESLVLLESGELLLFDVNDSRLTGSVTRFRGKKLLVPWNEHGKLAKGGWLSCEFSWHPRIVVVANSDAVFLVDFRLAKCTVSCLMKVELLDLTDAVEIDQFVSFSKAGSDGFFYAVASECRLVLFDIRTPCKPVLQWLHSHHYPHYMNVFRLSELRGSLGNDEFNLASEMGFAIVLGSFWTGDFSLFCYGPSLASLKKQRNSSNKPIKVSNPFYAWDLASELSLSGHDCPCSSCLIREELAKDDLPEWVDWQQKKKLVLGFFILDKDLSSLMSKPEDDTGFVLIRLMSSGKLESQRYKACWNMPSKMEPAHQESPLDAKDSLLCSVDDEDYRFPKMFKYIRLEYLYAHMNGSLTKILFSKFKSLSGGDGRSKQSAAPSRELLSNKLKTYGLTESTASFSVSDAVRDISMPISVFEAASKRLWTTLPMNILEMAFSNYEECRSVLVDSKKVYLDFSAVPDQNHLPPFILRKPSERSNKWSKRVKPGNDLIGPVIPLAASLVLKEICENGRSHLEKVNQFSPDTKLARESQLVLQASREMCVSQTDIDVSDDYVVSLEHNDTEETWGGPTDKNLLLYNPSSFPDSLPDVQKDVDLDDHKRYATMITKLSANKQGNDTNIDGSKFFDDLCPIDLKFDDSSEGNVGPKEMHSYSILKQQFKIWQQNFKPYADFCVQFKS